MLVFGEPVFFITPPAKGGKKKDSPGRGGGKSIGGGGGPRMGQTEEAAFVAQPSIAHGYGYNYGNYYGDK